MRISFDLDGTLIGASFPRAHRRWYGALLGGERLRAGTPQLFLALRAAGHELHVYTSSLRNPLGIRRTFAAHNLRVGRIVTDVASQRRLRAEGLNASKHPGLFGFGLHVDDDPGVALEAERLGFRCLIVEGDDPDWARSVLAAC